MEQNKLNESQQESNVVISKDESSNFEFSQNKAIMKVQKYFKFDTLGATFKKEIIGGVSTFLAMVYILSVNPAILSNSVSISDSTTKMNSQGVFLATALATAICTILMGIFANIPTAVSTSMGINAMFTYTLAGTAGVGYEGALITVMLSSIVFFTFSITPLRMMVLRAIPKGIIIGIGVSIGLFVAYVGFAGIGIYEMSSGLPVASFSAFKQTYPMILIGILTLGIILFLHAKKIPGAAIIAISIGFIISLILAYSVSADSYLVNNEETSAFYNTRHLSWGYKEMFSGFDSNLKNTFAEIGNSKIWSNSTVYICIFIFVFLNFFDATGTFAATNVQLNKKTGRNEELSNKGMIVDSASTIIGASMGTSPMGVYVESTVGIEQGARTGLASVVTGLLFFLAILLQPLFKAMPQCVTSAACVYVGIMMISDIQEIEWKTPEFSISTFFSIIFMITTYNIANGIAAGMVSYTFMMLITKKGKEVSWLLYGLSIIFVVYFISLAFIQ